MPRTSCSPLEIVKRQTREDAELDAYPEVKACLLSETRSLQKDGLERGDMDVAVGVLLCRRVLLTSIPAGRLKTPEGLTLIVRILEQLHKGRSALKRARSGRSGALWSGSGRVRVPPPMRTMPQKRTHDEQAAGDVPAEVENDAATAAGGSE